MLYGLQGWTPTILLRVYGWDLADAGRIYGTLALVAGSAGVLSGPVLSRYLLGRGVLDAPLRVAVLGAGMATFALATLPFQSSGEMALVSIGCASFLCHIAPGVNYNRHAGGDAEQYAWCGQWYVRCYDQCGWAGAGPNIGCRINRLYLSGHHGSCQVTGACRSVCWTYCRVSVESGTTGIRRA